MKKDATPVQELVTALATKAQQAAPNLAITSDEVRSKAIRNAATAILDNTKAILAASSQDVAANPQLTPAMVDRLKLDPLRIEAMAKGLTQIADLPNYLGKTLAQFKRPNGLLIKRVSIPLGVIGMIYESRPNVTADAAGLCVKSGNAVILRTGSESLNSSMAIAEAMNEAFDQLLPTNSVQLIPSTDRGAVDQLLKMEGMVDLIIPRGGKSLIAKISADSKLPMLYHLEGLCHTYIHHKADPKKAVEVTHNAKMRRTGICGATETVLFDPQCLSNGVAEKVVAKLLEAGCEVCGDEATQKLNGAITPATDQDWATEYLDAKISVKQVANITDALAHIAKFGSGHTDAIITEDTQAAEQFFNGLSSAILMHNASTQFADGGEFGMGAEIGIATGKLHARGPVGVEQLTTYKYLVSGNGTTRP